MGVKWDWAKKGAESDLPPLVVAPLRVQVRGLPPELEIRKLTILSCLLFKLAEREEGVTTMTGGRDPSPDICKVLVLPPSSSVKTKAELASLPADLGLK